MIEYVLRVLVIIAAAMIAIPYLSFKISQAVSFGWMSGQLMFLTSEKRRRPNRGE